MPRKGRLGSALSKAGLLKIYIMTNDYVQSDF